MSQQTTQHRNNTLFDLDHLNDGSFERMVQEIRTFAKNEEEVEYYIRLRLIEGLARRGKKERMGLPTYSVDFDHIPRRKRSALVKFLNIQPYYIEEEQKVGGGVVEQEYQGNNVKPSRKKRSRRSQEEEGNQLKKRRKTNCNVNFAELGLDPPPELPINLREEVEKRHGNNLMLVIMKELFATDLNTHNARFSIPASQIIHPEFLTQEEKETLKDKEGKKMKGLTVTLIEPSRQESNLCLKEWPMNNTFTYTLVSGWNKVSFNNSLKVHDIVQLWSFRSGGKLCFLLCKVSPQNRIEANKGRIGLKSQK